ncbi:MAG: archaemetzincin family Zn-dependent metalloprotease [Candidatus Odinarchaeia archaeon]
MIVTLLKVGSISKDILGKIQNKLEEVYPHIKVEISPYTMKVPEEAYNPHRNQYYAPLILEKIKSEFLTSNTLVLAVTDVDLYDNALNFIFGEAAPLIKTAIISLTRLRPEFYEMSHNEKLFVERAIKEAAHELGHLFGLPHCPNPECVMHFSNHIFMTDKKSIYPCNKCRSILIKRLKN